MVRYITTKTLTLQVYILASLFVVIACNWNPTYADGSCGNTPNLTLGKVFNVGNSPRSAVTVDLNGDGNLDIVVANLESNYISVLMGDGTGGFGTPNFISVGNRLAAVETGDFNGDNKIDLAVSSLATSSRFDPYIFILLGNGVGGFTVVSSFYVGGLVESIAVADFNNDGNADLALADQYNDGRVLLRFGDGTGNFTGSDFLPVGARAERIITQDFNGDGKPDLATTKWFIGPGHISVYLNNGTSGFAPPAVFTVGDNPSGLVAGDFNSDGKLDLAVTNRYSASISLLIGNGSGGFGGRTDRPVGKELTSIVKGDFNNDGRLDIVAASSVSQDVTVILGDGAGGFGVAASFLVGGAPTSIVIGDFNHDGKTDVVASKDGSPGAVAVLLNSCEANTPPLPGISVNDITMPEGSYPNTLTASFSVTLSAPSAQSVTVNYATAAGTASPDSDFGMVGGTLIFEPGETSKTILVPVYGEGVDEYDETFTLNLSNPIGGIIVRGQGTCTILNDDPPPSVSISDTPPLGEGNIGTTNARLFVNLATNSPKPITVDFSTADGTALAGIDYQATSGTITFSPGETFKIIDVPMIGDTFDEPNETFFVNLSNPMNVTINDGHAVVTIFNDDTPTLQLSQRSYSVSEGDGNVSVTVTRLGDSSIPATVKYATSDAAGLTDCNVINGIASSRCDYTVSVGTLQFAAGESTKSIFIPLIDDGYSEGNESFTITLSNPSAASLGSIASATVTITDNESVDSTSNPIDQTAFFVRENYIDFLGREPDAGGYQAWQEIINNCPPSGKDANGNFCDRIEVSSGFFRSEEFQGRGYFIYRFYSILGRIPRYNEFIPDFAKVSGFQSTTQLEASKSAFVQEFMSRQEFKSKYDGLTTPTAYVDGLLQATGLPNHPTRGFWINGLTAGTLTRADVLRGLVDSSELYAKFNTEAFVVMQYFGYLRRDPDILYLEWIRIMNENGGDYRGMISGFMNSVEYRKRFGN
ncbi:MAG TPA: Calx-beta domain-containing protein [Pyrinomonadaceae bacterium]